MFIQITEFRKGTIGHRKMRAWFLFRVTVTKYAVHRLVHEDILDKTNVQQFPRLLSRPTEHRSKQSN
jgi:hypothetical protein